VNYTVRWQQVAHNPEDLVISSFADRGDIEVEAEDFGPAFEAAKVVLDRICQEERAAEVERLKGQYPPRDADLLFPEIVMISMGSDEHHLYAEPQRVCDVDRVHPKPIIFIGSLEGREMVCGQCRRELEWSCPKALPVPDGHVSACEYILTCPQCRKSFVIHHAPRSIEDARR